MQRNDSGEAGYKQVRATGDWFWFQVNGLVNGERRTVAVNQQPVARDQSVNQKPTTYNLLPEPVVQEPLTVI